MPSRLDDISEQRKKKLERLRERGIDPYPHRFDQSHTASKAIEQLEAQEAGGKTKAEPVNIAGRIMAIRKMGKATFIDIRDGSGKIQLLFQTANYKEAELELFKDLDIGDIIGAGGTLLRTRTGEPTVSVTDFALLAKSLTPAIVDDT